MPRYCLLLLAALLFGALPAAAIGERAHAEIARMTVEQYLREDPLSSGIASLFQSDDNLRALYSGCAFPDWGFGGINPDVGEFTHWHPFMEAYIAVLHRRFPPPWDAAAQRQICFFLGVLCHNIADIPWHFSDDENKCFLAAGFEAEGASHVDIEVGCDIFLYAERALEPSVNTAAWFPLDLLPEVFQEAGRPVPREQLEQGTARSQSMFFGGWIAGALKRDSLRDKMPWVYKHYQDYYYGGLEHCAAVTSGAMRRVLLRLAGGYYFQNMPEYAPYVRRDDSYVPQLNITDCILLSDYPDNNTGGESFLEVGGGETTTRNALIQVDLKSIPPGANAGSATLWIHGAGIENHSASEPFTITLHRVLRPWESGAGRTDPVDGIAGRKSEAEECCWNHSGESAWGLPGCESAETDYDPEPVTVFNIPPGGDNQSWIRADISSAARHWIDTPSDNHGLLLRANPSNSPETVARFYSSEAFKGQADGFCGGKRVALRPALIIAPPDGGK